jgi:hypothetical protein
MKIRFYVDPETGASRAQPLPTGLSFSSRPVAIVGGRRLIANALDVPTVRGRFCPCGRAR